MSRKLNWKVWLECLLTASLFECLESTHSAHKPTDSDPSQKAQSMKGWSTLRCEWVRQFCQLHLILILTRTSHPPLPQRVPHQLHRSWYSKGNFKLTKSIYVHLPCWQQIWSTRERLEVWFKEVKQLRRRFDNSETIHLTQNFVPESDSELTWSVYFEPYY